MYHKNNLTTNQLNTLPTSWSHMT